MWLDNWRQTATGMEKEPGVKWNSGLQSRQVSAVAAGTWKRRRENGVGQSSPGIGDRRTLSEKCPKSHLLNFMPCCPHPCHAPRLLRGRLPHVLLHIAISFRSMWVSPMTHSAIPGSSNGQIYSYGQLDPRAEGRAGTCQNTLNHISCYVWLWRLHYTHYSATVQRLSCGTSSCSFVVALIKQSKRPSIDFLNVWS